MSRDKLKGARPITGFVAVAGIFLLSACLKSTEPQPSRLHLSGSWNYTGTQTSPVRETLTGTLTISSESGSSFQGHLELFAASVQGQTRGLTGTVSGSESASDVIDFDANLEANPRRHVGQIVADTVSGTWVGSASDGSVASGTFRIERQSQ
jgi:hypothetical protein